MAAGASPALDEAKLVGGSVVIPCVAGGGAIQEGEGGACGVVYFCEFGLDFGLHAIHGDVEEGGLHGPAVALEPLGGGELVDDIALVVLMAPVVLTEVLSDPKLPSEPRCRSSMLSPATGKRQASYGRRCWQSAGRRDSGMR